MSKVQHSQEPQVPKNNAVTVAVPVIQRTEKLAELLDSLKHVRPAKVVIADNGEMADRVDVYNQDWPFTLETLNLPYDCGIGKCRKRAAEAVDTEYALVVDNDMRVPANVDRLVQALRADPELGAVGGILEEDGELRAGACNLHDERLLGGRRALSQSIRQSPGTERVGGVPVARFDKLTNAIVVRTECLGDYTWDASLRDKEHLDFFVGHWEETDWEFAVCPEVIFQHNPTTGGEYYEKYRHGNEGRQRTAKEAFCEKWGYDEVIWGRTRWFGTSDRSLPERVYKSIEPSVPTKLSHPVKQVMNSVVG